MIQKDEEVFEEFPAFHILWEAAGLLAHSRGRQVALGQPPAASTSVLRAQPSVGTAGGPEKTHQYQPHPLFVLLTDDSENRFINCLFFQGC